MLEYLGFHLSFAHRAEAVPSDPLGDTVVCGHTHMPFVRLAHGRLVINRSACPTDGPERTGPCWARASNSAPTHFDIEAAATQLGQDSSYPDTTEWADYFLHARATDADALAAFAPREGRDPRP